MPERKKLLLGNWKMNHTIAEAKVFCDSLKETKELAKEKKILIGVCPSYLCLETLKKKAKGIIVGAQDVSAFEKGAYTAQVSIPMLKELGVTWSIIGHSERREYNGETNQGCNAKVKALVKNQMTAVYCVGESLETYEAGKTNEWVGTQIREGLEGLSKEDMDNVVIAYEPIWAIGTGKTATPEIAENVCGFIRDVLKDMFGKGVANKVKILYGGSVKPGNVHELIGQADIDGALVGGASLKAEDFKALVENL